MASAAAARNRAGVSRLRASAAAALCCIALAGVVALAGCGGDDELPDDIAGVCREVADRFAEIQAQPPSSWESAEERTRALYDVAVSGDEALAGLAPEAPDADAYSRYLTERAQVTAQLRRALGAFADRNARLYDSARAEANDGALARSRLAQQAGLPACAAVSGD